MCGFCHSNLSDDAIMQSLRECIAKGDAGFANFNTTSLSHIYIALMGVNGPIAHDLAETIITNFIAYVEKGGKLDGFILESCPSIENIKTQVSKINAMSRVTDKESQEKRRLEVFGAQADHGTLAPQDITTSTITTSTITTSWCNLI
jgi:hypothetical protein